MQTNGMFSKFNAHFRSMRDLLAVRSVPVFVTLASSSVDFVGQTRCPPCHDIQGYKGWWHGPRYARKLDIQHEIFHVLRHRANNGAYHLPMQY